MVWLSINPDAEPLTSVQVVAGTYLKPVEKVTPTDMAAYYNEYVDPTVCDLSLSNDSLVLRFGEKRDLETDDMDRLFYEHQDFLCNVGGSILSAIAQGRELDRGYTRWLLKSYNPTTKTYDT
jgi:hypothetical protein